MRIRATVPAENHSKDASSASGGYLSKPIISCLRLAVYVLRDAVGISIEATLISIIFPTTRTPPTWSPAASPSSAAVFFRPFPKQRHIRVPYRDLWRKFSLAIIQRGPRAATVGDSSFGSPHPAAATSSTRQDLPDFRYLSFRHSLGLVESPFQPGWATTRLPFRNHDSAKGQIFRAVSFDASERRAAAVSRN